ncbi:peptidoglycan DD-metalloendopeptidase family protein [Micromonospora terminaliae]|uniref:M23 family metallopeptidase n=1 Tax=Micromonospora terminaliae TaxID=1914461 RepID=A0AAJ3DPB1_9ACTN|nr:M23 family metallopeptidase [Micromonospora terminaliae]NES31355.1 M23 family metallopeptidase [Micromonospora terminaliae]QGL49824.1 peptidoglycan DD-metalloendopeptidase family protein [Micromonospora terminaliae]
MSAAAGVTAPVRRKLRVGVLVTAVTTVLTLLCCVGGAGAFLLTELGGDQKDGVLAGLNCDPAYQVDLTGDMPRFTEYGDGQLRNAAVIIKVGQDLKVPARGWVIALATAMQESALRNLANSKVSASLALPHEGVGADHDSLGLFQQRPGWGSVEQRMTPSYTARKFYEKMVTVRDWQHRPLTEVAQRVQVSAFPDAYAKHEDLAGRIVDALAGGAARTVEIAGKAVCDAAAGARIAASGWTAPLPGGVVSAFRTAERPSHNGVDLAAGKRTEIHAASAGRVLVARCDPDHSGKRDCDRDGWPGKGGCGWFVDILHAGGYITRYCHMIERPRVVPGQSVAAGEVIGLSGTSGNSSGPHLHFEVHVEGDRSSRGAINPVPFMRARGAPVDGTA